jgi:hypothetical protein
MERTVRYATEKGNRRTSPFILPYPSHLKLFLAINAEFVDTSYGDDGFTPSLLVLEYAFLIFAVQCFAQQHVNVVSSLLRMETTQAYFLNQTHATIKLAFDR